VTKGVLEPAVADATPGRGHECPKHMVHGPCGGVQADGTCEIGGLTCPFVARPTTEPQMRVAPVPLEAGTRPFVLADVPAPPLDLDAFRRSADVLAGAVDAGLTGDHGRARVQLPPVLRAQALADAGLAPWIGLNCRDRNRVALEGELAGLAAVGVTAVHCVTGDHTATGNRPDAAPVFDLDGTALAALAAARGLTASVAEAPLAPPVGERPARLVAKAAAGAAVCVVNHTGDAAVVADFVAACRGLGASDVTFLACVPVVISAASVAELRRFTGLATPPGLLDRVAGARSPWATGVDEAVRFAEAVLAVPDLAGVDLSGVAGAGEEATMTEAMAAVGRRLR
jgi:methylenetetrahydrofolate reductase (NADPH)